MVDNRSAGVLGIGGGINFKGGDISGTAAKTSDDRASQGTEYFMFENEEEQNTSQPFQDENKQLLYASLNSLACMNVASVIQKKKNTIIVDNEENSNNFNSPAVTKIIGNEKRHNKDKNE